MASLMINNSVAGKVWVLRTKKAGLWNQQE